MGFWFRELGGRNWSVLEGVAFNCRWLKETVEKFSGRPFAHLNFIGGGAQSDLWCQIQADVLGCEIRQVEHPIRANARGAALLAGIALGETSVEELGAHVAIDEVYLPESGAGATYDELFGEFTNIYKKTKGIYRRLNS